MNNIFVINSLLCDELNIKDVNVKFVYENLLINEENIKKINETGMFAKATLYYNYNYFKSIFINPTSQKILYIENTINLNDPRFSINPLYVDNVSSLPYLENNAMKDYLTFNLIYSSLNMIVNGYFILILCYCLISNILLMISILYKDLKEIAIFSLRGFSSSQLLFIYFIPLFINLFISLSLIFISSLFIKGIIITFLISIISLLLTYFYFKRKSLRDLLKEEILC